MKKINKNPKSTKKVRPVNSIIQYQERNQVNSISIGGGSDDLMDIEIDKNNDVTLVPKNDDTKENVIDITGNATDLLEIVHGKEKEHSQLIPKRDNTKENVLELKGTEDEKELLEITQNGGTEKTNLNPKHDKYKENKLEVNGDDYENELITLEEPETETDTTKITIHHDKLKENIVISGDPQLLDIEHNEDVNPTILTVKHDNYKENNIVSGNKELLDIKNGDKEKMDETILTVLHDNSKANMIKIIGEATSLMDVQNDEYYTNLIPQHDVTKENYLEASQENGLLEITHGDGVNSTILKVLQDPDKENSLLIEAKDNKLLSIKYTDDGLTQLIPHHDDTKQDKIISYHFNDLSPNDVQCSIFGDTTKELFVGNNTKKETGVYDSRTNLTEYNLNRDNLDFSNDPIIYIFDKNDKQVSSAYSIALLNLIRDIQIKTGVGL